MGLSELRGEYNLTQKELAEKTGISESAIAMYEVGERTPSLKRAKILADFFDVSIEDIFFSHNPHDKRANSNSKNESE